jgi:hypothetical protein
MTLAEYYDYFPLPQNHAPILFHLVSTLVEMITMLCRRVALRSRDSLLFAAEMVAVYDSGQ